MSDRFRLIFDQFAGALILEDGSGTIVETNSAATRLLKCRPGILLGHRLSEFVSAPTSEKLGALRQNLRASESAALDGQLIAADGSAVSARLEIVRIQHDGAENNAPLFLICAAEEARRGADDPGAMSQAVFRINADNESRCVSSGRSVQDEPLDWTRELLASPAIGAATRRAWSGETVHVPPAWFMPAETALANSTPLKLWLKTTVTPAHFSAGKPAEIIVNIQDCTAEYVDAARREQRDVRMLLSMLAQLLLHDLNNYLSIIVAQASGMAPGQLPSPQAGAIIDAANQAAGLVKESAGMGGPTASPQQEIDVRPAVNDAAALLSHLFPKSVIQVEHGAGVPKMRANEELLKRMLVALCCNAQAGAPPGGTLLIKTFRAGEHSQEGPCAAISVEEGNPTPRNPSSSGAVGVNDPLEAALVRAIVRYHGGQLEIINSRHQGRIWEATFPSPQQAGQPQEQAEKLHERRTPLVGPAETLEKKSRRVKSVKILIADDEENFRTFMSWALRERGYEVIVASDGQEACDRFGEAPETFSLVVLDAYMPRMGGLEAYLRMQVLQPQLPVLFASGFVRGPSVDALVGGCPGPAGVLLKPFSTDDLLSAVEKALNPEPE